MDERSDGLKVGRDEHLHSSVSDQELREENVGQSSESRRTSRRKTHVRRASVLVQQDHLGASIQRLRMIETKQENVSTWREGRGGETRKTREAQAYLDQRSSTTRTPTRILRRELGGISFVG